MSNTATKTMENLDKLITRYAPIDLATGDHCKDTMTIDLRNIRHYAFSILCELNNLERQYEALKRDMRIVRLYEEQSKSIINVAKNFNESKGES